MSARPVPWTGFSPYLRTQADLLNKLRRDLARLEADPNSDDAAWNFFVTADHMRDWERSREQSPLDARSDPLLATVWDLASHAKHFRTFPEVASVHEVGRKGYFQADAFQPDAFDTVRLVVDVDEEKGRVTISAVDLARQVVDWWAERLS